MTSNTDGVRELSAGVFCRREKKREYEWTGTRMTPCA